MIQEGSRGLGVIGQSPPDYRDRLHLSTARVTAPDHIDLREQRNTKGQLATPAIFDQHGLGSCTANAANAVAQYVEHLDGDPDWDRLSRLYTYYWSRAKIGTTAEDSGAMIRDAFAVLAERGAPRETFWPYVEPKFTIQPPVEEKRALEHRALEYLSVTDGNEGAMVSCLAEGYPFAYGFAVYRSFWGVGSDGKWGGARGAIDGYHAVCCWGYDFRPDALGFPDGGWIMRNSWSEDFGDQGYFYVPRRYMTDEAFDCWTIRKIYR